MNLWGAAAEVLFADAAGAVVDGTFIAPPAAGIPVRVILSRHDPVADFPGMQTQIRAPSWEAHLMQTEVATRPRVGLDTLILPAGTYVINDVAEDVERCEWVCDLGG